MSRARDLAALISGGFTADDIPNLDASKITTGSLAADRIPGLAASKITTGTFADARISNSSVVQHSTPFDDNKLVNDISTLALRQASDANRSAYSTNSQSVDVFQDDTGIDTTTNASRNASEFVSSVVSNLASNFTNFNFNQSPFTSWSGVNYATDDVVNSSDLNGDLGAGSYLQLPNNSQNVSRYCFFGDSISNLQFGSSYEWELLVIKYNMAQSFHGILYESNIANLSNNSGTSAAINTSYEAVTNANSDTFYIWENSGYAGADGVQARGSGGNTSISNYDQKGNVVTRWVYDGSAGTLKVATNDLNSGTAIQPLTLAGSTSQASNSGRKIATNGRPRMFFGHHNSPGEARFQLWYKVIEDQTSATGNFTGTTITAPSSVSSMGAIITYQDNAGTNALNTDIVLQLSADGGTNYSTATLTALPDFSTGIKMAKVNDLAVTAGTSLKYKLNFANQASGTKEARIRGVALQY